MRDCANRGYPEWFCRYVEEINRAGGVYHRMDFGHGLVMNGDYDMTKYLHHYGIPEDLSGKTMLDIGTNSGFFAFECARRGADVTAIDLGGYGYGDLVEKIGDALGLRVAYVEKSVYDLDESFGQFDLVLCGSLLLHLTDIFRAIRNIRIICRGQAIIATGIIPDYENTVSGVWDQLPWWLRPLKVLASSKERSPQQAPEKRPLCEFVGCKEVGGGGDYCSFWLPTMAALKKMLMVAGFPRVEEVSRFTLRSEHERKPLSTPHGVVKACI